MVLCWLVVFGVWRDLGLFVLLIVSVVVFVNSGGWCNSFVLWFCYWLHLFGWCGILLGCCFDVCHMVLNVLVIWYFVVMV